MNTPAIAPTEPVETINKRLLDLYGKDSHGYPKFRLLWTTGQTEHRWIKDREIYTDYGLFLRRETGVFEVLRYPFDQDKWVLEHLQINSNPQLPYLFSYEPIWIFGNANSVPIPTWSGIEALVSLVLYKEDFRENPEILTDDEEIKMEKERVRAREILMEESPLIPSMLKHGEAVIVPSNYNEVSDKVGSNG